MPHGAVRKLLGEERYGLYLMSRRQLIAEIDTQSTINDHKFTLKQIIEGLKLFLKEHPYIIQCYENVGRKHLLNLVREGILKCDMSRTPYLYYRTPECIVNPRVGPDIDYNSLFKEQAPAIRENAETRVKAAMEGSLFVIADFLRSLEVLYSDVPAIHNKYVRLLGNLFARLTRSGVLTTYTKARSAMVFRRTNLYAQFVT